jgi:hypothetical protein
MNATVEIVKLSSTCWVTVDSKYDIKKIAAGIFAVRKIDGNQVVAIMGCFQTLKEAVACVEKVAA